VIVRPLEHRDYLACLEEMRDFTRSRKNDSEDEIWLVEHPPIFTLGQASLSEHLLSPGNIPVVQTERGGQVTYHGPGQVVAYLMLDLRRRGLMVRNLVCQMELAVIALLARYRVVATTKKGAPGVYLNQRSSEGTDSPGPKIAALGIKVTRGCSYHGLALNVKMDLEPYSRINPCGFPNLKITDLVSVLGVLNGSSESGSASFMMETSENQMREVADLLGQELQQHLTPAA
jgi:lipoyl(octanoyl) transferase